MSGIIIADSSYPVDQNTQCRFWAKVNKTDTCWLWTAALYHDGYGAFLCKVNSKHRVVRAHRYSWLVHHGEIPSGLLVLHRCDVRTCVNPDHLFLGTQADNRADMVQKGRVVKAGTFKRGFQRGTERWCAKLDDEKVLEIRRRWAAGESQNDLARFYCVSQSNISLIVTRQKWTHV